MKIKIMVSAEGGANPRANPHGTKYRGILSPILAFLNYYNYLSYIHIPETQSWVQ